MPDALSELLSRDSKKGEMSGEIKVKTVLESYPRCKMTFKKMLHSINECSTDDVLQPAVV